MKASRLQLSFLLFLVAAGCVIAVVRFTAWREGVWREQCRTNIMRLYEPMYCCVPMEKGLPLGAPIDMNDVRLFFRDGKLPRCPSGAEYRIVPIVGAAPPTCPYHGVLVTEEEWGQRQMDQMERMEREMAQQAAQRTVNPRGEGSPPSDPPRSKALPTSSRAVFSWTHLTPEAGAISALFRARRTDDASDLSVTTCITEDVTYDRLGFQETIESPIGKTLLDWQPSNR